jgi:hypothetical protein
MGSTLFLALAALALAGAPGSSKAGPCDIYASGGTPCVAAHSTVRALYSAYNGSLYQVRRSSDNATQNIGVLSVGGVANAATQDSFCSGTTCVITIIYDQSGRGNHLTQAPPGGFNGPAAGGYDNLANATAAQITINGNKAYGVYVAAGTGYRNNSTSGVATGDQPEGMYAIFDGTHYNGGCCFDYGNAETSSRDTGNGHMEAIYFGNIKVWGYGPGNGPWVMADLENGLFSGVNAGYNSNDPTVNYRYLTAIVKGTANLWAIRAGNAQSGGLSTFYSGSRPNVSGYNPMHKEGAIILGIGGDNSNGSAGTFYEGAMTSGYPSDSTESSVQSNIVAAGYGVTSASSYGLSVTKAGTGSGTVTSSTGGINCGSTCSATIASGTTVTLTATAASGSTFGGWSGSCTGTGSCVVTMTAARAVTATFNAASGYTLTVTKAGTGSGTVTSSTGGINCGSTCSATLASGTTVTLTATAASGSTFGGWSGACTGTGSCIVGMTAARAVTATFNGSGGTCTTVTGGQSGNFNTTGAACYIVNGTINGWGCSNADGRTVTVNGTAVTCGQLPLPGSSPYTFRFTAGTYSWASFYWW